MSTAIVVQAHPVPSHKARRLVVKMTAGAVLLAAASAGMYQGAQAVARHYNQQPAAVSYATPDAIARTLAGAWHTPARMGAFIDAASIQTPDVVSVVKAVN